MAESTGDDFIVPATVTVLPSYMRNAIVNIVSILPSLIPNILILIVGLKSSSIKDKFRDSIITMTCGNLFSGVTSLLFHCFYVLAHLTAMDVDFFLCSFLRRLVVAAYSPMLYGCVLVATDRFFTVCWNCHFSRSNIFVLNLILLFFPLFIFISQMSSSRILKEDICGPTKAAFASWVGTVNTWLLIAYPIVALFLNLYILSYVNKNAKRLRTNGVKINTRETYSERSVLYGMLLQSLLPLITQVPMMIAIQLYYHSVPIPSIVWQFCNAIYHLNLTLNPIFTVIFVRQFRLDVLRLLKMDATSTVFIFKQQSCNVTNSTNK